jgi:hypothetical protein
MYHRSGQQRTKRVDSWIIMLNAGEEFLMFVHFRTKRKDFATKLMLR